MKTSRRQFPVDVLWCSNQRQGASNRWSYPPAVERHLRALTAGKTVLQLFGGMSRWGVKLDIDPRTRPHVRGDAWMPPFRKDAFDVTIIDPPYFAINQQMKQQLLRAAAYITREHLFWFHTQWIAGDSGMRIAHAWLIRVGDSCSVRCLQQFSVPAHKTKPRLYFTRGPALRYNRWLDGQMGIDFTKEQSA